MQGTTVTTTDLIAAVLSFFAAIGGFRGVKKLIKGASTIIDVSAKMELTEKNLTTVVTKLDTHSKRIDEIERTIGAYKYTEERMKRIDGQMWAVMNAADFGVWIADNNGMCLECNDAMVSIMRCNREEIIGNAWIDIIHPDDRVSIVSRWGEFVRGDRVLFQADYRFKSPTSGEITYVHGVAIRPLVQGIRSASIFGWVKIRKVTSAPEGIDHA